MKSRPAHPPTPENARDRIVAAATSEFAAHGFDGTRIEAIAHAAGVNKALLYYYFPGKAELYRELVLEHMQAAGRLLRAALEPPAPPAATLDRLVRAYPQLVAERPHAPQFLVRELLNGWGHLRDEDLSILPVTVQPIVTTVERGIASGAFRPVPPLFVHLVAVSAYMFFHISRTGRARSARVTGIAAIDPDPQEFVDFLAGTLLRGLAAGAPAAPPRPEGDAR
jgi:AcrR family transcriptional regulator